MKLFKPLTALTVDGNLFVEGYKTEKPEPSEYLSSEMNKLDLEKWQASKARYPVQEGSKWELGMIIIKHGNHLCVVDSLVYNAILSKGIDISHLSDRIEVVEPDTEGVTMFYPFVILNPIQEEESQEDIWNDVLQETSGMIWSDTGTVKELIELMKSKFTITRKQP